MVMGCVKDSNGEFDLGHKKSARIWSNVLSLVNTSMNSTSSAGCVKIRILKGVCVKWHKRSGHTPSCFHP